MNDDHWYDMELDRERRGLHDQLPPELTANAEFIGYADCPWCGSWTEEGIVCPHCNGTNCVEVWV